MWVYPEISTLGDIPRYHARQRPDAPAIMMASERLTWLDLDAASNRTSNALRASGLKSEDCVGFLGKNTPFVAIALFGTAKAGMTFTPLNWRLAATEIAEILRDSECRLMFVESEFVELAQEALSRAGLALQMVVFTGQSDQLASFLGGSTTDDPLAPMPVTTTALRVYTSGTTGLPKGVELSHENFNMTRLCEHLETAISWSADDVFLMFMPPDATKPVQWRRRLYALCVPT